ncbi:adenylate/guanylate cyclase domain-containing protein [Iodidimonas gelatinilytica]|uniref:adenylate/guanylate cyclase domain-containing protein n=1 Tax=Iodidimonas gelatinilytica TaxID=1236966 RepID=UPI001B2FEE8F|nr:adenylate/guanylate cyclase domain-containing protein [Iodidimonas gelatinilytica]
MAMLFLDTHGFGKLDDEGASLFIENVLQPMSACCAQLEGRPSIINTWGDGLFLAFNNIVDAAEAALILQNEFRKINLEKAGLPHTLSVRIGCHFGPVQQYIDPFLKRPNIFGKHVTIAARIEQVTLPGSIYVSEPFASILTTSSDHNCKCEYIGRIKIRTSEGIMPLFSLRYATPQSRSQNSFPVPAKEQ